MLLRAFMVGVFFTPGDSPTRPLSPVCPSVTIKGVLAPWSSSLFSGFHFPPLSASISFTADTGTECKEIGQTLPCPAETHLRRFRELISRVGNPER